MPAATGTTPVRVRMQFPAEPFLLLYSGRGRIRKEMFFTKCGLDDPSSEFFNKNELDGSQDVFSGVLPPNEKNCAVQAL